MKIQNLAIIFIIIILPISMVLTAYVQGQVKTLNLQILYDSKLNNATYDAIKAFQLNTVNSSTSDIVNSKMRDIEASVNTFFTAISSNFNMAGYNGDVLKNYVPALVYTLYDGYYIYSPFTNTLNDTKVIESSKYKDGERIYGLKPYIYYSCRYVNSNLDIVINYTLDNYITIQGEVNGKGIHKSGYLIDNITFDGDKVKYRGIDIEKEPKLEEYVGNEKLTYIKINGVKYYQGTDGRWFSLLNGEKRYEEDPFKYESNDAATKYYIEAYKFKEWMEDNNILDLKESDAVDENGQRLKGLEDEDGNIVYEFQNRNIFTYNENGISIEEPTSVFNEHRLAIIRRSIERNLSIAIKNYNNYTGVTTEFQMPKLKEDEWDSILNNVCMISFLQGLSIGGKIYNGYSIIANNLNEEVVSEDSIYIAEKNDSLGNPGSYYKIGDKTINKTETINYNNYIGVFNIDFQRKSIPKLNTETNLTEITYYYPKPQLGSYTSIINETNKDERLGDNIYSYLKNTDLQSLAKLYYTALGRERYGMYKTERNSAELKDTYR